MKRRLLLVEDDPLLVEPMVEFLSARGFEVHAAGEREEAEALLNNFEYQVVVTDLSLKGVSFDGLDIVQLACVGP